MPLRGFLIYEIVVSYYSGGKIFFPFAQLCSGQRETILNQLSQLTKLAR